MELKFIDKLINQPYNNTVKQIIVKLLTLYSKSSNLNISIAILILLFCNITSNIFDFINNQMYLTLNRFFNTMPVEGYLDDLLGQQLFIHLLLLVVVMSTIVLFLIFLFVLLVLNVYFLVLIDILFFILNNLYVYLIVNDIYLNNLLYFLLY